MEVFQPDFLIHYGVKGMKWGVRKDDRESRRVEKRQKKVRKFQQKSSSMSATIRDLKEQRNSLPPGFRTAYERNALTSDIVSLENRKRTVDADIKRIREGKLTSTQRKLLVGAAVTAAVAGYVAYNVSKETGALNAGKARVQKLLSGADSLFPKKDALSSSNMSPDEVLSKVSKAINPDYATPGGRMNCRRTTFAYEMRRRGFDVSATTSAIGAGQNETGLQNMLGGRTRPASITSMTSHLQTTGNLRSRVRGDNRKQAANFSKSVSFADWDEVHKRIIRDRGYVGDRPERALRAVKTSFNKAYQSRISDAVSTLPKGARGEAVFNFKGFGHSLSFEKFGDNVVFFDNQKAQKYDLSEIGDFITKWGGSPTEVNFTRLDDLDLNMNQVARWVKAAS